MKTIAEKLQDGGNKHRYVFLVKREPKDNVVYVDTFCMLEVPGMKKEHLDMMIALSPNYLLNERKRDSAKLLNMNIRLKYNRPFLYFNGVFLIESDEEISGSELTRYLCSLYTRRELEQFLEKIVYAS